MKPLKLFSQLLIIFFFTHIFFKTTLNFISKNKTFTHLLVVMKTTKLENDFKMFELWDQIQEIEKFVWWGEISYWRIPDRPIVILAKLYKIGCDSIEIALIEYDLAE